MVIRTPTVHRLAEDQRHFTVPGVCRICGSSKCLPVAKLPFDMKLSEIESLITRCDDCGCYWRSFDPGVDFNQHFERQSYTRPEYEDYFRGTRQAFLRSLAQWALSELEPRRAHPRVLDVGCAYGHLLDVFLEAGCESTGIEPVDWLRVRLNETGRCRVYPRVQDLPSGDRNYDIIALIDSLYYFEDPLQALRELAARLSPTGNMLIRVTNRTPLLNACTKFLKRKITSRGFGDQIFAFSHKSMIIALRESGLTAKSFCYFERKPVSGRGIEGLFYYRVLPAIAAATRLKVTPGLTYLCTRQRRISQVTPHI